MEDLVGDISQTQKASDAIWALEGSDQRLELLKTSLVVPHLEG